MYLVEGVVLASEWTSSPPGRGNHCSDCFSDMRDSSNSGNSDDTCPTWEHGLHFHEIESLARDIDWSGCRE